MKIYVNDNEIKKDYSELNLPQILENIKNELENQIIKKIFINEVVVNERYLHESSIEKEEINKLEFILEDNEILINDTLNEIKKYLPKLKDGCTETADLLRNGDLNSAHEKYQYILEGLNWCSQTITNIVNLINEEKYITKINDILISLNKILGELMKAYENADHILVADILEYEIVDFINEFIEFNNKIREEIN